MSGAFLCESKRQREKEEGLQDISKNCQRSYFKETNIVTSGAHTQGFFSCSSRTVTSHAWSVVMSPVPKKKKSAPSYDAHEVWVEASRPPGVAQRAEGTGGTFHKQWLSCRCTRNYMLRIRVLLLPWSASGDRCAQIRLGLLVCKYAFSSAGVAHAVSDVVVVRLLRVSRRKTSSRSCSRKSRKT